MNNLPPELIIHIISFLPLKSLIAARGVNSRWRFYSQIAPLHPARKTLLDLYLATTVHPNFHRIREFLLPYLRDFDREAYIADLVSLGCILPDDFELWVLEWPSQAVYFWAWPGLEEEHTSNEWYPFGSNLLGTGPATFGTIRVPRKDAGESRVTCKGLGLWSGSHIWGWLVVDRKGRLNDRRKGRIFWSEPKSFVSHGDPDGLCTLVDPPFSENFIGWLGEQLDWDRHDVDWSMDGIYLAGEWDPEFGITDATGRNEEMEER